MYLKTNHIVVFFQSYNTTFRLPSIILKWMNDITGTGEARPGMLTSLWMLINLSLFTQGTLSRIKLFYVIVTLSVEKFVDINERGRSCLTLIKIHLKLICFNAETKNSKIFRNEVKNRYRVKKYLSCHRFLDSLYSVKSRIQPFQKHFDG